MRWLMHVNKEPVYDVIQGIGKFTFEPNKPTRIDDDFIAGRILEHCKLRGLVEVPVIESENGIKADTEAGRKAAKEAIAFGQKKLVDNYIEEQKGRIAANYPILPPSPVVQKIAAEQGIDFREYGLTPPGVKINSSKPNERIEQLEETVKALLEQNKLLLAKFEEGSRKRTQ